MTNPNASLIGLSTVKLALMARQARAQLGPIARAEPIAVVGMGCRFPGGVDSPESYWSLLRDGVDAVGDIPRDRWDVDAVYDPDPAAPGKMSVRQGGFLDRVDTFDAGFFGLMRREAERMDPQHRVFLEVAVDALDHAGLSRDRLAGSATGVFIASYYNDYTFLQFADRENIDARTLTGTQHSVLANRLSYLLDLRGPSISLDTACSSSLVAVHLACQSLRMGESDVALAGGVSLMLSADMMITLSKVGFMSLTGRCRTFDALADGFIRGEGCGVVVLKRLSDAISDNDRTLAVIRGSAVNQDGRSTVLAAPNGLAQQALLRGALANAQLTPDRVGFIEAHGTATPLGDPIEVEALAAAIGAPRADGSICYLGSAKANLGHLEAAAGVAGLIKAVLMLQRGEIPRQVHFTKLNPHLSLGGTCLAVAEQHRPWHAGAMPRVAGVSGFGVGGTNAHVLLEEAPSLSGPEPPEAEEARLLVLSAQSSAALRALAAAWVPFLETTPACAASLTSTAGVRRSHYDHRVALVGRSKKAFAAQLQGFIDEQAASVAVGRRPQGGASRLAFVFSGQGPQFPQMGRELAVREPVFRDTLGDLDARLQRLAGWSLADALAAPPESSRVEETEIAQPLMFAIQVALAALWNAWGVRPDVVVGHSVGEVAALHVAGVLSLDEALRIVWHRGRIMQRATGRGRMAAAGISLGEADSLVREIGPELSVAAINGPRSVVLSGTGAALDAALAALDARGVSHRALPVSYAFHSAQMEPFVRELTTAIGPLTPQPGRVAVYSTVTGAAIDSTQIDAAYFGRNLRQTVRFATAVQAILERGVDAFVEIAPHPALAASIAECVAEHEQAVPVLASMRRGRDERETMLQACAGVYAVGITPSWEAVNTAITVPVDLPAYPWQRERFWLRDVLRAPAHFDVGGSEPAPGLLGIRRDERDPHGTVIYDHSWPSQQLAWVADHEIGGHIVMPAAALLEAMRMAAQDARPTRAPSIVDFVVHRPLILDGATTWTIVVAPEREQARIEVRARGGTGRIEEDDAVLIASARTKAPGANPSLNTASLSGEWCHDVDGVYRAFTNLGVRFGPEFRTLNRWRVDAEAGEGWLARADGTSADVARDGVHPTLLDGALQLCVVAAGGGTPSLLLPMAIESYAVHAPATAPLSAHVTVIERGIAGSVTASVRLFSERGAHMASLDGVRFAPAEDALLAEVGPYEVRWHPAISLVPAVAPTDASGAWVVFTDGSEFGGRLLAALKDSGGRCLEVRPGTTTAGHTSSGWTIAPSDEDAMGRCLEDLTWRAGLGLRGIVHTWSIDAESRPSLDPHGDWLTTGSILALLQALGRAPMPDVPVWLITQGAQPATGRVSNPRSAGVWGLASVAAPEYPDLSCHVVDLDAPATPSDVDALVGELIKPQAFGLRVALRAGQQYLPRFERLAWNRGRRSLSAVPPTSRLVAATPGTLDGLEWQPADAQRLREGEARVRVLAAGVNFRDVLLTLGMYPSEGASLGSECAGVVEAVGEGVSTLRRGDAAFGFAPGSLGTEVIAPARFLARVPPGMRVEEAAALPVAFLTAMFGLQRVAALRPRATVLIHSAAGGVGLAAVQIARRLGARVLATAGSLAKRELLRSLGVEGVFDSRSLTFADGVLAATCGAGVDVVLNSLAGAFIPAGLRALGTGGWFLELGKRDIWTPGQMSAARPDVRYRAYDLGDEAVADASLIPDLLAELCAALTEGSLHPLPVRTFPFDEAAAAFRYMAQARHVGKLVLRAPARAGDGESRSIAYPGATYWITGGTGALGLRTARWLVNAGARHIVLTGRRLPSNDAQRIIDECIAAGAEVRCRLADAGNERSMAAVRDEILESMPPLRGVVHAAGVVDDGMLVGQTWARWNAVLQGKARGARVLDAMTRAVTLDFFVLYSSAGLMLGPRGQGAYAVANAELDALAWARRSAGLPALSVAWGQWREAGMAARMVAGGNDGWSARGLGWIAPHEGFTCLERLLRDEASYAAVLPIDWHRFLSALPAGVDAAFFDAVKPAKQEQRRRPVVQSALDASVVDSWRSAPSGQRRELLVAHLTGRTRHVLGIESDVLLDDQMALKDAGLDSLMAVELRNVLTRSLGTSLPATLLFDYPSLGALATYLTRVLSLTPEGPGAMPGKAHHDAAQDVAALSEAAAEALLIAELDRGTGLKR